MQNKEIYNKFVKAFKANRSGFKSLTKLQDLKVGFSVQRQYDKKIIKKLGIEKGMLYKALIHVAISDKHLEDTSLDKKPLRIRATMNLVDSEGFHADFQYMKKKRWRPVDLVSTDYSYSVESNGFFYKKKVINADKILSSIYESHMKPTSMKGTWFKIKVLFFHVLLANLFKLIANGIRLLIWLLSGERYYHRSGKDRFIRNYSIEIPSKPKQVPPKKIKIFGYETDAWVISTYCMIHMLIFGVTYRLGFKPDYIRYILKYNLITIFYAISTLTLYEAIFIRFIRFLKPFAFLKFLVGITTDHSVRLKYKELKI